MPKGSWQEFEKPDLRPSSEISLQSYSKKELPVRIQRTKGGKGGKTVTLIKGLSSSLDDLKNILKLLKSQLGTGGTLKGETIELQGNQVNAAIDILKNQGYRPKQSGG